MLLITTSQLKMKIISVYLGLLIFLKKIKLPVFSFNRNQNKCLHEIYIQ